MDTIWFDESQWPQLSQYLEEGDGKPYRGALEHNAQLIGGFESPLGMELPATVD